KVKDKIKGAIVMTQPMMTSFIREDRKQPTAYDTPVPIGAPTGNRGDATARANAQALNRTITESQPAVILKTSIGEHGTVFIQGGRNTGQYATPSIILAGEHYNMIARMLELGVPVKLKVNLQTKFFEDDKNSYNVIAEIPGTDPALKDEVVMIGGHLDSWHTATGASDNADGAAAVMEAMRILMAIGARPKRTIRVGIWSGEEEGLYGSKAYVKSHLEGDANKTAREKMSVYLNIDPGTGPIYGFYMENNEAAKAIFDAWLEPFKDLKARRNIIQGIGNTDHLSFLAPGIDIPAFNVIQDYTNYDVRMHHTNVDTFERVNEADLKQNAIVLASFAYQAAMRTEKIPFVKKQQ